MVTMKGKYLLNKAKPFIGATFMQLGFAGMYVLSKMAFNRGMDTFVFVTYRHVWASVAIVPFAIFLEKGPRPAMTGSVFVKIFLLSLLEPAISQNLYFWGTKYTPATFGAAMCNMTPAVTFVMACLFRLERIRIKSIRSQAKIWGTVATVGGAMVMTFVQGPLVIPRWLMSKQQSATVNNNIADQTTDTNNTTNFIKGSIMIMISCVAWACFMILQAVTMRTYPFALSLTAWICVIGAILDVIVALTMEGGVLKPQLWSLGLDINFLAATFSGIICSSVAYYIQCELMKERGPVFITAFNPLAMVFVAIISYFALSEEIYLGRMIGAIVIIAGLYLILWGKAKDYGNLQPAAEANSTDHENIEITKQQKLLSCRPNDDTSIDF